MISHDFRKFLCIAITLLVILVPLLLVAEADYSGSAPDGRTGAPGENLCTGCHSDFPENSGDGNLQILGIPGLVMPGETITVTVQLGDPGQQRWGFEITAIDADDATGNGAGVFTITDAANTQLSNNAEPARDYVKHTTAGTQSGTLDGPVNWQFDWTAPESGGEVWFYAAGNAANGSGSSGDYIYTTSTSTTVSPTNRVPMTGVYGLFVLVIIISLAVVITYNFMPRTAGNQPE